MLKWKIIWENISPSASLVFNLIGSLFSTWELPHSTSPTLSSVELSSVEDLSSQHLEVKMLEISTNKIAPEFARIDLSDHNVQTGGGGSRQCEEDNRAAGAGDTRGAGLQEDIETQSSHKRYR